MKKKNGGHILFLIMEYLPIFSGHAIYLNSLMPFLRKFGYGFSVLTTNAERLPEKEKINGVDVYRIKQEYPKRFWEIKFSLQVMLFLIRYRHCFDILHINGHLDTYGLINIICKLLGKKTVCQMVLFGTDDPMTIMNSYRWMGLRSKVLICIDQFMCISRRIAESYFQAKWPDRKLVYIPQGVDIDRFHLPSIKKKIALRKDLGLPENDKIAIFVGAVIQRKGVDTIISAWKKVNEKYPNALLLLIGTYEFSDEDKNKNSLNQYVDRLKAEIKKYNLKVKFCGRKDTVEDYLMCSDLFVFPSRQEGFGNVIIEAMGCGLPVIVTPMDGVAKETVVNKTNGFIIEGHEQLSEKICLLFEDEKLSKKMGEIGRKMAIDKFSFEKISKAYHHVYRYLLNS